MFPWPLPSSSWRSPSFNSRRHETFQGGHCRNAAPAQPLTKFFPDAPASWRAITGWHLLTHTQGIPDYTTDAFDIRKDYTEDELVRLAVARTLEVPAGSRWNYSNRQRRKQVH